MARSQPSVETSVNEVEKDGCGSNYGSPGFLSSKAAVSERTVELVGSRPRGVTNEVIPVYQTKASLSRGQSAKVGRK